MTSKENQQLAMPELHKNIYQFDMSRIFIKKYNSLSEVYQQTRFDMSCINHAISGKYRHSYHYIWLDENTLSELDERVINALKPKKLNTKIVLQLEIGTNNIIGTYNSVREVCKKNNGYKPSNISGCCRGEQNTAYGYVWKYKEDYNV